MTEKEKAIALAKNVTTGMYEFCAYINEHCQYKLGNKLQSGIIKSNNLNLLMFAMEFEHHIMQTVKKYYED